MMAACLIFGDGIIDWDFKIGVNRPRPNETEPHLRVVTVNEISESVPREHVAKGRSFTSGHACNNVALATALDRSADKAALSEYEAFSRFLG